jgi:hypothetical protein
MRQVLVFALVMLVACALAGCQKVGGESATQKEFKRLYEEYSDRFHEKMIESAKGMSPAQITAEAARIWDEVFAGHGDVLDARVKEILAELDDAEPFDETLYVEIASGERVQPTEDQPAGTAVKQFLWNPVGTAQMALNNWLARLLQRPSFALRRLLTANAGLFWKAVDRDINHPKLQMRQGPLVFTVSLTRDVDHYQVEKVRWLRPKSMGPIGITGGTEEGIQEPTPGQEGAETPTTPETEKPAEGEAPSGTGTGTGAEQPEG